MEAHNKRIHHSFEHLFTTDIQHALCVWFSVHAQRTTRTRRAADFGYHWIDDTNTATSVQNRRAKPDFYAQKDEK